MTIAARSVLIVIDTINDSFVDWDEHSRRLLTTHINELVDNFHKKSFPVIWVRQEFESDLSDAFLSMRKNSLKKYIKGTQGAQFLSELKITKPDIEIIKKRYSDFYKTQLDELLNVIQPEFIVLAGVNTHACVQTTAIDAYQRDFEIILAIDCIQSYNPDWHMSSLEYLGGSIAKLRTNKEIFELF